MARGGKRDGAGRPAGSKNRRTEEAAEKTREITEKAAAAGVMPLEVMLEAMREAHKAGNTALALECAQMAAPYCHPRLGAVQVNGDVNGKFVVQTVHGVDGAKMFGLPPEGGGG